MNLHARKLAPLDGVVEGVRRVGERAGVDEDAGEAPVLRRPDPIDEETFVIRLAAIDRRAPVRTSAARL